MARQALSTTVVGSYPQPDWLVDRTLLSKGVPRVRLRSIWRVPEEILEQAQDDATVVAIRDMERASIDVISDGEIRRESYSNRFATALEGVDVDQPAVITDRYGNQTQVPRVVGPIRRTRPVELRDMQFLRRNTDRPAKITLPGPFTMAQQARNEHYRDVEELAMAYAEAVNAEARDLQAAGADLIQLDEPWLRNDPEAAKRYAVPGYSFLPQLAEPGMPGAVAHRSLRGGWLGIKRVGRRLPRLRFGLSKLLGTRVRNAHVRSFVSSRIRPSPGFDKLALFPRLDLLELCELRGSVWLLHESRDAGGGKSDDHGRVASFDCHPLGSAAEGPAQP